MNREDLVKCLCERPGWGGLANENKSKTLTLKQKKKKMENLKAKSKFTAVQFILRKGERGPQSGRINDQMDTRA